MYKVLRVFLGQSLLLIFINGILVLFSYSLLKPLTSSLVHTIFSYVLWIPFQSLPWTLYWVNYVPPLPLDIALQFYLVPLFGIYLSVNSFCLICCFYFYVFGRPFIFPDLGEVTSGKRFSMHSSSSFPLSGYQSYMI